MRSILVVSLVCAFPAWAEPNQQATDLLRKGRAAEAKGKHADAAAALEAAAKLTPEDPAVLAELGWVDFELHDLTAAEMNTRGAVGRLPLVTDDLFRNDKTNALRGAALYNLGQILEARANKEGAIVAYSDSLKARTNPVVSARLRKLDPAAADAADPLRPTAMQGPFASVGEFCKKVAAPGSSIGGDDADCRCGEALANEGAKKLSRGFDDIAVFPRHGCADGVDQELDVAVKHGRSWYVTAVGTGTVNDGSGHCGQAEWHFAGVTFQPLASGGAIARVEYATSGSCSHLANEWGWDNRSVVAIGIGPSDKPSATPDIAEKLVDTDGGTTTRKPQVNDTLAWSKDGSLVITGTFANTGLALGGDLRGAHHLVFP